MALTLREIREMMIAKAAEIESTREHKCIVCGDNLPRHGALCECCEKNAAINQLRRLAQADNRYASILAEVEAAEAQQDPPADPQPDPAPPSDPV